MTMFNVRDITHSDESIRNTESAVSLGSMELLSIFQLFVLVSLPVISQLDSVPVLLHVCLSALLPL